MGRDRRPRPATRLFSVNFPLISPPCAILEEVPDKGPQRCREAREIGRHRAVSRGVEQRIQHLRPPCGRVAERHRSGGQRLCQGGRRPRWRTGDGDRHLPFGEIQPPPPQLTPFHRLGEQPFVYAKVHTCNFGAEKNPAGTSASPTSTPPAARRVWGRGGHLHRRTRPRAAAQLPRKGRCAGTRSGDPKNTAF